MKKKLLNPLLETAEIFLYYSPMFIYNNPKSIYMELGLS